MKYISMSQKELDKYEIVKKSIAGEITVAKAGELLNLSERHMYRVRKIIRERGAKGLIHGNRGKLSNRRTPESEKEKAKELLRRHYYDFGPTHASEKLEERHNIKKDPKTIRQIMIEEGLWTPKSRKQIKYRASRPRKEHYGEMAQFDGSYERWLGEGFGEICLLAAIDDAAGIVTHAKFVQDEGTFPVFGFWREYFLANGKPRAIYLDKLRTYYNNHPSALDDKEMLTQFQRAMRELGVESIPAHSPQAKGRVERLFGTLQDRLIKEMRLENVSDIESANRFLREKFLPWFNVRYSVEPAKKANLHRKITKKERARLPAVLSRQSTRVVQNDFTIRFANGWYQLEKKQPATVRPKESVLIEERLDGSVWIRLRGRYLNYTLLPDKPKKREKQPWVIAASQKKSQKQPHKPSKNHPWRKYSVISPSSQRKKVAVS